MSSHNILQLMTHLNDFEITINHVICEFATRLSALIDANFFLILENRDGRKLCGSSALVDDYVKGSLRPFDSDQIATFDAKVAANHFVHLAASGGGVGGGASGGVGIRDVGLNGSVSSVAGVGAGYNALDLSCEFEDVEEVKPASTSETSTRKRATKNNKRRSAAVAAAVVATAAEVENDVDDIDDGGGGGAEVDDDDDVITRKRFRMTYDEFGNIEDDICILDEEDHDPDYDDAAAAAKNAASSEASGGVVPPASSTRTRGPSMENVLAMDPLLTTEAFEVDVSTLNLPFNKIQVLQSLEDPAAIFQKDSVEFKLASSILYDFGKELANVCPYTGDGIKAKVFFHQNFKNFLSIFPCLKSDLIQNIRIAKKSAEAHMKNNARAGFNSVFDKKKKEKEGFLPIAYA